ncbi:hypothetical protein PS2015_198 [Pseudohongiella spirulinae]|uniref:Uncharacterized protein n=1 Tax=Pseudohongiella spirulinae TaxID=1249552 RepID=A0A0S2K990_9GAMM|nr:hypothetical protein PS2015_198 [Pseudohongiella spirulinae]
MLSRFIVKFYSGLLEASMWIILIASFLLGLSEGGVVLGVGLALFAFVLCVVFFGAFFILVDIQKRLQSIDEKTKT